MRLDDLISRCTTSPDDRWDICAELYNALDTGSAQPIDLAPFASSFALFWRDVDDHVRPFQQASGHSWRWSDDYQDPRNEAGLLLDILGYVPGPEVAAELQQALTLSDERLVMYAALSLLRQGHALSPATIDRIAACDETRVLFHESLAEMGYQFLFPPSHADSQSIARSKLVAWLTHPNEWECAPDEIELVSDFGEDLFLYQFRTTGNHRTSRLGWVAGISGRVTFSDYHSAGTADPAEHARRMLAQIPE
jgi:hypothetical protein